MKKMDTKLSEILGNHSPCMDLTEEQLNLYERNLRPYIFNHKDEIKRFNTIIVKERENETADICMAGRDSPIVAHELVMEQMEDCPDELVKYTILNDCIIYFKQGYTDHEPEVRHVYVLIFSADNKKTSVLKLSFNHSSLYKISDMKN